MILAISAIPGSELDGITTPIAIAGHAIGYALFGAALAWASRRRDTTTWLQLLTIVAVAGLLNETEQLFVPGRAFDGVDVLVDLLGGALGITLGMLLFATTDE